MIKDNYSFYPLYGKFALKSVESGKLTFNQIEAGRKSIRRNINKKGIVWIRVFTNISVTSKPIAVRMGKGKGNHSYWMAVVRAGQVIFEISGVDSSTASKALNRAACKLPFKTKIVKLNF
jgi:large subunit ribosomal protein L16